MKSQQQKESEPRRMENLYCCYADGCPFDSLFVSSDVVLTKKVWERTQKISHFETASNSF